MSDKTLAARLRDYAQRFADDYGHNVAADLTAAADRLSAPEAGAGLVRYGFERDDEADDWWAFIPTATGHYVRYDDHTAALAAERERAERAEAEIATLRAALKPFADLAGDYELSSDFALADGAVATVGDVRRARAALVTPPAVEGTKP